MSLQKVGKVHTERATTASILFKMIILNSEEKFTRLVQFYGTNRMCSFYKHGCLTYYLNHKNQKLSFPVPPGKTDQLVVDGNVKMGV